MSGRRRAMAFEPATIIASAVTGGLFGAGANMLLQGRSRWLDTRSYASALAREVLANGHKLASWREQIRADQVKASGPRGRRDLVIIVPPCPLSADDMLVFRSSIGGIGRLPPWLVIDVLKLYEWFRELHERYGQLCELEPDRADEFVGRLSAILHHLEGRVLTELEVIATTPYWRKLRFEFAAWRSDRAKEKHGDRSGAA